MKNDTIAWYEACIIKHEHSIELKKALHAHWEAYFGGDYPSWSDAIGPVAIKQRELIDGIEKDRKAIEELRGMIKAEEKAKEKKKWIF